MTDLSKTISAKSDQLNADDLLGKTVTIKITDVSIKGDEQPVVIHYEGDNGKPYKPCKSMRRVLVHVWGADGAKYKGRQLTLYCDPSVRFGSMEVGGIRISHMSHIDKQITMALTATRANKKPFTVRPLVEDSPQINPYGISGKDGVSYFDDADKWANEMKSRIDRIEKIDHYSAFLNVNQKYISATSEIAPDQADDVKKYLDEKWSKAKAGVT